MTTDQTSTRIDRYRTAERRLWDHYGIEPTERFIELESPAVRLRVVEVGSGKPVLFVPGTGGTGPYWAPLVRELQGFRCLLLDRPGWGLSSPVDYSKHEYKSLVAEVLLGTLDALGLDQTDVVGGSIGNLWALRLAQRHPSRVGRIVLVGGFPHPEVEVPRFPKLLASPIGALIVRLPAKPAMIRKQLRGLGHGASLDAGRIPDEFFDWRVAFARETESMRSERDMVRAILERRGFKPGLTLEDDELRAIEQPALMVYGTADPSGSVDIWKGLMSRLPRGEFLLVNEGGHLPWWDDPSRVASAISSFLAE